MITSVGFSWSFPEWACFPRHPAGGYDSSLLLASRREWRTAKIDGNRARDLRNEAALLALGWHVVTIWECALKSAAARAWLETKLPRLLEG